jgi:RecA-family ATPase
MEITPQEAILEPWLNTKSLNMLHAKRGVGKTHMGLAIAYAVATGTSYLRWKAPKPRKVVYLDGEMSSYSLQSRLQAISEATPCAPALLDNLLIFTPDLQLGPIPDLAERGWHLAVRELIDDTELVVVDNLSCLARSGGQENDSDSWDVMSEWALGLRREGVAVLFMHHSGKSGQQRGTSRREDILNVVINLKHPADYSSEKGAQFEVHFEKGRELYGEDSKPFLAQMLTK